MNHRAAGRDPGGATEETVPHNFAGRPVPPPQT